MLRQERLRLYIDALAHAVDLERRLDAVWVSGGGEDTFDISIRPRGAPLTLASMDEISVRMRLLADEDVEGAWEALNTAWESRQWWAENEYSGHPDEDAPEHLTAALRTSIDNLKVVCRRSLE